MCSPSSPILFRSIDADFWIEAKTRLYFGMTFNIYFFLFLLGDVGGSERKLPQIGFTLHSVSPGLILTTPHEAVILQVLVT